jgi:hypothetical protein
VDALVESRPGEVLTGAPYDEVPWVATAYHGGRVDVARGLLDAAALATTGTGLLGAPHATSGPDFAPHWADSPAVGTITPGGLAHAGAPTSPVESAARRRVPWVVVVCAVVAAAAVLASWLVGSWIGDDELDTADDDGTPGPAVGAPSPWWPTPAPRYTGPDGPEGLVAGPTYGKDEPTFLMDLADLPFEFRVPATWGCLRSDAPDPDVVRWVCMDESQIFSGTSLDSASGVIEVRPCPDGCGPTQWAAIRDQLPARPVPWQVIDETTMYRRSTTGSGDRTRVTMSMSHVFAAHGSGTLDTHVSVELSGLAVDERSMQKIVNDIRAETP